LIDPESGLYLCTRAQVIGVYACISCIKVITTTNSNQCRCQHWQQDPGQPNPGLGGAARDKKRESGAFFALIWGPDGDNRLFVVRDASLILGICNSLQIGKH
jgi:hypothetical protein